MTLSSRIPLLSVLPPRVRRELLWIAIALLIGMVAMPPLIWLVGSRVLGPYALGGLATLWQQFFRGLSSGTFAFWWVAVGPYFLLLALRILIRLIWPRGAAQSPPPAAPR